MPCKTEFVYNSFRRTMFINIYLPILIQLNYMIQDKPKAKH